MRLQPCQLMTEFVTKGFVYEDKVFTDKPEDLNREEGIFAELDLDDPENLLTKHLHRRFGSAHIDTLYHQHQPLTRINRKDLYAIADHDTYHSSQLPFAVFQLNEKCGLADTHTGQIVIPPLYDSLVYVPEHPYLCAKQDGIFSFLDTAGATHSLLSFSDAQEDSFFPFLQAFSPDRVYTGIFDLEGNLRFAGADILSFSEDCRRDNELMRCRLLTGEYSTCLLLNDGSMPIDGVEGNLIYYHGGYLLKKGKRYGVLNENFQLIAVPNLTRKDATALLRARELMEGGEKK